MWQRLLNWLPGGRRRRWYAAGLGADMQALLPQVVPGYARLDQAQRRHLSGLARVMVETVDFEGCGGLTVTRQMQAVVAAQACLLLVGFSGLRRPFRNVRTVLLYPAGQKLEMPGRFGKMATLGSAHEAGPVILSWTDALDGGMRQHGRAQSGAT